MKTLFFSMVAAVAVTGSAAFAGGSFGNNTSGFGGLQIDAGTYGGAFAERNQDVPGSVKTGSSGSSKVSLGAYSNGKLCDTPSCANTDGGFEATFGQKANMEGYSISHSQKPAFVGGETLAGGSIDITYGDGTKKFFGAEAGTLGTAVGVGAGPNVDSYAYTVGSSNVGGATSGDLCGNCAVKGSYAVANQLSKSGSVAYGGNLSQVENFTGASAFVDLMPGN